MSLNSFSFIISFIPLLFAMTILQFFVKITGKQIFSKIQLLVMLIYSYYFVGSADFRFAICVAAITLISYIVGILTEKKKENKLYVYTGVILCLAILGYFKYCNFFIDSISSILGTASVTLNVILPIGISFYIFTAISYMIDVYRRKIKAESDILNFGLFISFFAKVTAGPIIRSGEFLSQVQNYKGVNLDNFSKGLQIFVFGLFKKIVLADRLAVFVDDVFFAPSAFNTATVILAVISYSLQIYFDFSGYSDMAIGMSKIFGFNFSKNFNLPYIAENISDFWKRWHISLSSWLQEYVYIPLGGSRKGTIRTYINLILTMFISGLWHGAGYTYIIWGLMFGVASCISRFVKQKRNMQSKAALVKIVKIIGTYIVVTLFWVMFRATDVNNAIEVYKALFTVHGGISQMYVWSFFALACLLISIAAAVIRAKKANEAYINGFYVTMNLKKFLPLVIIFTFIGLTIMMGYFGNTAFIYGKF